MQLSRYVLSHKLDSGTVYFNTKNNQIPKRPETVTNICNYCK